MLADFTSVDAAAHATSAIIAAGILPAALELMDHATIECVESSIYAAGYPRDAAAVLLIEVDGALAGLDDDVLAVQRICRESGARDIRTASDAGERARLWQGRKKAFGAMGRMASHLAVQDAVVPRTRSRRSSHGSQRSANARRIHVCNVFHAGDGNLHPNVPYNGDDADEAARVHARDARDHGSVHRRGRHDHGRARRRPRQAALHGGDLFPGDSLDAMCRLRSAFDPGAARQSREGRPVAQLPRMAASPAAHA